VIGAASVIEKISVLAAVGVESSLQMLTASAKRGRGIERNVNARDRAERQAIERDVNDRVHYFMLARAEHRRQKDNPHRLCGLPYTFLSQKDQLLFAAVPGNSQPAVFGPEFFDQERAVVR